MTCYTPPSCNSQQLHSWKSSRGLLQYPRISSCYQQRICIKKEQHMTNSLQQKILSKLPNWFISLRMKQKTAPCTLTTKCKIHEHRLCTQHHFYIALCAKFSCLDNYQYSINSDAKLTPHQCGSGYAERYQLLGVCLKIGMMSLAYLKQLFRFGHYFTHSTKKNGTIEATLKRWEKKHT